MWGSSDEGSALWDVLVVERYTLEDDFNAEASDVGVDFRGSGHGHGGIATSDGPWGDIEGRDVKAAGLAVGTLGSVVSTELLANVEVGAGEGDSKDGT